VTFEHALCTRVSAKRMSSRVDNAPPVVAERDFQSILQVLERRASENGSTPALYFFHDQSAPVSQSTFDAWSWRELRDRARGVAAELIALPSARPGARILLVYPAGLGFVAAFFGCLYAGMIPVPVPPPRRAEGLGRWRHVALDAGIAGVLASSDLIAAMEPLLADVAGGGFCLAPADADPSYPHSDAGAGLEAPRPAPADLAFLQYTSGSTSQPKGVMISHANMMANLCQISLGYEITPADRMASWLPHYHDMGLIGTILSPVHDGYAVASMAPASFLRRPLRWLEMATHFRATMLGGPNFAFDHCVRRAGAETAAELDLSTVRVAFTGAETIRPQTLSRFHATFAPSGFRYDTFHACYGMAEATLFVSGNRPAEPPYLLSVRRDALIASGEVAEPRQGTAPADASRLDLTGCGRAVAGLDLAIVDPVAHRRKGEGEVGEIWVRGPNISAGYWRRPEQNAETFDLRLDGVPGWFRTGDLGFLHEGQLYITGRLKDVIIIRGENHYPQDIEETASASHPALAEGNAGAVALEIGGEERLGIVCELSRSGMRGIDADAVFEALRGAISRQHDVQLAVAVLIRPSSLPRTPSGKVQRFACRDGLTGDTLPMVARWEARLDDGQSAIAGAATWLDELRRYPLARREDLLRRRLQEELARLAGLPDGQLPLPDKGFFDLGLDSVAVVNFGAILERELGLRPEPTLMFEYPTLGALAAHLAASLLSDAPPAIAPTTGIELIAQRQQRQGDGAFAPALVAEIAALQKLLDADPAEPRSAIAPSARQKPFHLADRDSR
jgi:acyl-CoA synthetase (AMP-forming)/AMP-acid ligase II/acyl carrier protein